MNIKCFEDLDENLQSVVNFYEKELQDVREVIKAIKNVDEIETNGDINLFIAKIYIKFLNQSVVQKVLRKNNYKFEYIDSKGNRKSRLYTKKDISNTLYNFSQNVEYPESLRNVIDKILFYNYNAQRSRGHYLKVPRHKLLQKNVQTNYYY